MPHKLFQKLNDLKSCIITNKEEWSATSIANTLQACSRLTTGGFGILASVSMQQLLSKPRTLSKKDTVNILNALVKWHSSGEKCKGRR